jgi:isochorismate pyruvate lyase
MSELTRPVAFVAGRVYIAGMTSYTSDPRRHTAETAETMADVRYEIDRIDRVLVEILAERQSFMDAAARIKPQRGQVRDEARIEDVVAKVLAECPKHGLAPEIAEPVWRLLIERCIAYEFDAFDAMEAEPELANTAAPRSSSD